MVMVYWRVNFTALIILMTSSICVFVCKCFINDSNLLLREINDSKDYESQMYVLWQCCIVCLW